MVAINLCKQFRTFGSTWMGVFISGAIASTWLMSLMGALSWNLAKSSGIAIALWLLLRTFLHTGLFVIAHDAMHGNIIPKYPVINGWIGQLALGLYGFLPYRTCRKLHWQHHRYPAQE
jgi:beta-carotene ketolase (CrtW type)